MHTRSPFGRRAFVECGFRGRQGAELEQTPRAPQPAPKAAPTQDLAEHRRKLMNAINKDAYNGIDIFEGTTPIREAAAPGAPDLGPPGDAGVDISSIIGTSSKIWERLKQD
jgi:hypothetical protein